MVKQLSKKQQFTLHLLLSCSIFGCSSHAPAPVYDLYAKTSNNTHKNTPNKNIQSKKYTRASHTSESDLTGYTFSNSYSNSNEIKTTHTVMPGDTLFAIAWENAVSVEDLVKINKIRGNTIYPGQKLLLESNNNTPVFQANSLIGALNEEVLQRPAQIPSVNNTPPKNVNSSRKVVALTNNSSVIDPKSNFTRNTIKDAKIQKTLPPRKVDTKKIVTSIQKQTTGIQKGKSAGLNWIWPTNGRVIAKFSNQLNANRGLDIAALKGQPVRATAPGRVVYEGNGLRGYGNLVIIKHDNNYLSAYAHNEKIHVSENEYVNAGQRIADVGSSGTSSDKLHFEIRYKGKPVDPLNYLPEKN